jgi:hypothetical protein
MVGPLPMKILILRMVDPVRNRIKDWTGLDWIELVRWLFCCWFLWNRKTMDAMLLLLLAVVVVVLGRTW